MKAKQQWQIDFFDNIYAVWFYRWYMHRVYSMYVTKCWWFLLQTSLLTWLTATESNSRQPSEIVRNEVIWKRPQSNLNWRSHQHSEGRKVCRLSCAQPKWCHDPRSKLVYSMQLVGSHTSRNELKKWQCINKTDFSKQF